VRNIYFVGNKHYKDGELKSIITTKEKVAFKFWVNNAYDPDKIEYDLYQLKSFYNDAGFADFQLISVNPQLSKNKNYFDITYVIDEGQQYNLGALQIDNKIEGINVDELQKFITVKSGSRYNQDSLEKIADKIAVHLENKGYADIGVSVELRKRDQELKKIDIDFLIAKADKVYIKQINISGNVKTQDKVIRREFKIAENDIYSREEIEKGRRNLINLDYFENIAIEPSATPVPDKYNLNVRVREKATASIGLEGGYSSAEGPFARLSYSERNFLGTGKALNSAVQKGKKSISYSLGLTEPHFLDRNMSLGGSFFVSQSGMTKGSFGSVSQPYKVKSYGARLTLGYDITDDLSHEVYYLYKHDRLKGGSASSVYIIEQEGKFNTSAVGHNLTYDKTDNRIFPKNGYITSASQEYAGLGGDIKFLKHEVDFNSYKSFADNQYTIKLLVSAGVINGVGGKKVHIRDRFNLGDPIFRGFSAGGMGPRVKGTKEGLGGQRYYKVTTEFSFPLGLPKEMNVIGNVFLDYGSLWGFDKHKKTQLDSSDVNTSKKPNISAGAGILWITKVAPIRVDWAIPLKYKKYDDQQRWHFRFTASF
jgi:outer membrane protein insertion porin family